MARRARASAFLVCCITISCGDDPVPPDAGDAFDAGPVDSSTPTDAPPVDGGADATVDASVGCSAGMRAASPFGGGAGTVDDPYIVCTTEHLVNVATEPTAHFVLWEDLDSSGLPSDFYIPELQGTFDGLGHVISGYRLIGDLFDAGLFGVLGDDAVVRGLSLAEVNVEGNISVGAIAGRSSGHVIDCHVLSGTVTGEERVGGLVGEYRSALDGGEEIRDSSSAATVTSGPGAVAVGGILGSGSAATLRLENVHFTGEVNADTGFSVGGIAGQLFPGVIVRASSTGRVVGFEEVGGLVGSMTVGSIERSFSSGEVIGHQVTGGLLGGTDAAGAITMSDSYSRAAIRDQGAARIETPMNHGGLVGSSGVASLAIERCYFAGSITVDATGTDYWGGGLVGTGRGNRVVSSFNAGTVAITARTVNSSAIYALEAYGTVSNVFYDAFRTGLDRCWVNQTIASPDCTPVNVGNSMPDYFFDPASPPMDSWDFSATGPWTAVAGAYPELR